MITPYSCFRRREKWHLVFCTERIKGYKAHEIVGRHFRIFYPPEDIADGKPERELQIATASGRFEERKDGDCARMVPVLGRP